jgi:alpha-ketoglutarate-dependent taurine dioxygenase
MDEEYMFKSYTINDSRLPLIIEPENGSAADPRQLISLYETNKEYFESKLLIHGGLLFRGYSTLDLKSFEDFARASSDGELLNYLDGTSPRTKKNANVYTSTEYPAEFFISLHNELSYAHKWPSKLFFLCKVAAERGGETPLADSRSLLAKLPPNTVRRFKDKGVKYVRNLHGGYGMGLSWQTTFETEDKSVVEKYCREANIDMTWKEDGGLRLTQVRPATAKHPKTGEEVWFNQVDQFHPTEMDQETYECMMDIMKEEDIPKNAFFGDGNPIDSGMLDEIREITKRYMISFPWRVGDLLVIDNMLTSHGRMPFVGPREILVAMS